jgi:HPr kinase/phosphorylase
MSERLQLQGTAIAIEGRGVLLRGPSGAGKSTLALSLIEEGAVLIADDLCEVCRTGDRLIIDLPAAVEATFRGAIERRGHGIERVAYAGPMPLALVVDLEKARAGVLVRSAGTVRMLGLTVRRVVLDPFQPGAVAALRKMTLPGLVD